MASGDLISSLDVMTLFGVFLPVLGDSLILYDYVVMFRLSLTQVPCLFRSRHDIGLFDHLVHSLLLLPCVMTIPFLVTPRISAFAGCDISLLVIVAFDSINELNVPNCYFKPEYNMRLFSIDI